MERPQRLMPCHMACLVFRMQRQFKTSSRNSILFVSRMMISCYPRDVSEMCGVGRSDPAPTATAAAASAGSAQLCQQSSGAIVGTTAGRWAATGITGSQQVSPGICCIATWIWIQEISRYAEGRSRSAAQAAATSHSARQRRRHWLREGGHRGKYPCMCLYLCGHGHLARLH